MPTFRRLHRQLDPWPKVTHGDPHSLAVEYEVERLGVQIAGKRV